MSSESFPEPSKFYSRIVGGAPESRSPYNRPRPHPAFDTFSLTYAPQEYDGTSINPSIIARQPVNLPPIQFPGHLPGANVERYHRQPSLGPLDISEMPQFPVAHQPASVAQFAINAGQQAPLDQPFILVQPHTIPTNPNPCVQCKWDGCKMMIGPSNQHMISHLSDVHHLRDLAIPGSLVTCCWGICGGVFSTGHRGLTQHIRVTHLGVANTSVCPYCGQNVHVANRSNHLRIQHPGMTQ